MLHALIPTFLNNNCIDLLQVDRNLTFQRRLQTKLLESYLETGHKSATCYHQIPGEKGFHPKGQPCLAHHFKPQKTRQNLHWKNPPHLSQRWPRLVHLLGRWWSISFEVQMTLCLLTIFNKPTTLMECSMPNSCCRHEMLSWQNSQENCRKLLSGQCFQYGRFFTNGFQAEHHLWIYVWTARKWE